MSTILPAKLTNAPPPTQHCVAVLSSAAKGSYQQAVSCARKDNFAVFGKPRSVPKRLQNIFAL